MNADSSSKAWLLLAAPLVLWSCRSQPEPGPLTPPELSFRVQNYAGSPLAGPTDFTRETPIPAEALTLEQALFVDCRVLFLEDMPVSAMDPLATRTRLIAASRGEDPVLSSIVLASGARVGVNKSAADFIARVNRGQLGRFVELGAPSAALPTGATAWFEATSEEWIQVPESGRVQKLVSLHVSHLADTDESPSVLLSVEDLAAPQVRQGEDELDAEAPRQPVLRRELICLEDLLPTDGQPLALVFHSPFGNQRGALVAILRTLRPTDEIGGGLLARCAKDLGDGAASAEASQPRSLEIRTLASAFRALDLARFHRSGLLFLTTRTGAELAEDLALAAEEEALAAYVRTLPDDEGSFDLDDSSETGWLLERRAYQFLATLMIEDPPLAPELTGILLRHAGEVGRYPALVREVISRSKSLDELRTKLVEENRIFLEDSNPGARVRALDWLAARDRAPAGFDPFGESSERRKALAAAREERMAQVELERTGAAQ